MRKGMLIPAVLATALALGACGGGEETGGGGTAAATTLSMVDNAFEPASLTVSSGATVEVSNDGEAPHNITVEGAEIDEDFDPGQSGSVTFGLEPGEYTMFCEYHRDAGMEGTLTVS